MLAKLKTWRAHHTGLNLLIACGFLVQYKEIILENEALKNIDEMIVFFDMLVHEEKQKLDQLVTVVFFYQSI